MATIVATLWAAAPALAADGDPYVRSCLVVNDATGCTTTPTLHGAPHTVAASPDGRQLYVVTLTGALQTIDREPVTGALTPQGDTQAPFSLAGALDMAMSHDGATLLVSAGGRVLSFARNLQTGALTYTACAAGIGCDSQIQGSPYGLAFSPDDRFIYVRTEGGLDSLRRDLTQVECYTDAQTLGCLDVTALGGQGTQIGVSGDIVVVPFFTSNNTPQGPVPGGGVAAFDRHDDGTLTQRTGTSGGCVSVEGKIAGNPDQCLIGGTSLTSPGVTTISPDARFVYVGSGSSLTVVPLAPGGALQPPTGAVGVGTALRLVAASDGLLVSSFGGMIRYFDAGSTTVRGCFDAGGAGGCQPLGGLAGDQNNETRLAADPAGLNVYATGEQKGMLASIVRDYGPACRAVSAAVPFGLSTPIRLDCSDPNGDPLTYAIVSGPAKGQLGGADQGQVTYTPAPGFSGADQFSYRATGHGVTSAPATAALSVAGPPLAAPIDNDHDGFAAAQDCNDNNASIHPGAREIRGNKVDENCDRIVEPFPTITSSVATRWSIHGTRFKLVQLTISQPPKGFKVQIRCAGKQCPFKRATLKGKAKKGVANVLGSLKQSRRAFRAGQTVEVWVSARGFNTKVARLVLKRGRIPSTRSLCVLPGTSKPRKSCN